MTRDPRMSHEVRDTWPCPGSGREEKELTSRQSLSLMHLKMDVIGRELYQMRADLDMVRHEVNRHGCRIGLTEVPPAADSPDLAPLTPKAAHDRY
jgi:hypothetical protein